MNKLTQAWHLRQDGEAFPVSAHIYCMEDDDLSSEADAASFIISSRSSDQELAKYVLDAWMALLIEQEIPYDADSEVIEKTISSSIASLPFHFQYSLDTHQLLAIHHELGNFNDVDSLYSFVDKVRVNLSKTQESIKRSLNQQFCRVRYGGQFNSVSGNSEIWFRISSVGYNWANTVYEFASNINRSRRLSQITICRDSESDYGFDDNGKPEYFYKAKDGVLYKHMPIDEFFREEHEHSLVFECIDINEGIITSMWKSMKNGKTYQDTVNEMESIGINHQRDLWGYFIKKEVYSHCMPSGPRGRR